ncbi:MAG: DUF1569 domain-containing protein [Daejeonella sp.]
MKNVFDKAVADELLNRINNLTPDSQPNWGKMRVAQMLAHCNVTYELIYDNIHSKPNPVMKFILKLLVKNKVVGEKGYKQSSPTAPVFLVKVDQDFEKQKRRLTDYILRTQELGGRYFDGKESHSFGKLTQQEWNNMLYKHIDHHLTQFGV